MTNSSAAPSMIAPLSRMRGRRPRRSRRRSSVIALRPRSRPAAPGTAAGSRRAGACATAPARARRGPASRRDRRRRRRASARARRSAAASVVARRGPTACCAHQRRRAWPKAQAWTCCDSAVDAPVSSSMHLGPNRLPQVGERAPRRPSTRSSCAGSRQRRRQPQDLDGVERRVHARRQVVPPGPSSSTMPSACSSSRMRSAAAKSRFCLGLGALRRCSASMSASSPSPLWNQSSALSLEQARAAPRSPCSVAGSSIAHQPRQRQRRVEIVAQAPRPRRRRPRPAAASPAAR